MIPAGAHGDAGGLAHRLVGALAPALADAATPEVVATARAAARELGLSGLERVLAACAEHTGRPWPPELVPALERVRRLAARAVEGGSLDPFRQADRELAGLADELAALQWSPVWRADADATPRTATLSLADALDELPLADDAARDLARRVRLLPPVAAALRAALDWLVGDSGHPLALRVEDSLLEVLCERIAFGALTAASEVLAAAGGNLGLGPGPVGTWMVRVPLHTGRPTYLMLVHGGVPVAIPWHAVLRLHMASAAELGERRELGGWPVVQGPLGGDRPKAGEVPLALVAHGRKRGWIVADRLVWRLPAEFVATAESAPAPGLTTPVQTDDGERFWLADPGWLLHSIAAPALSGQEPPAAPRAEVFPTAAPTGGVAPERTPPPPAARAGEPRREPVVPRTEAKPAPAPAPGAQSAPTPATAGVAPPEARPVPRFWPLTSAEVEPLGVEPVGPAPPPLPPALTSSALPPEASRRGTPPQPTAAIPRIARTALVAEDSITARIFLARLLARLGFEVRMVDTAAGLRAELERGGWALVCVDIELPDEAGTEFLAGLVARHGAGTSFVALVRDEQDRSAARRAGIEPMLRKPFDDQELHQVLARLGLLPRRPS